ncbi:FAD-binding dehydrogenase [Helcobacillus massiliensis]|uniref:FAD-binding dehydrogenase n=1 Tax=Helcobacillus massiliensis TaxID=521392 RepID=UPI0021A2976C|nr:FAD-binding dehydrogenase [Helcobacillus massiliensis]MCT1557667.1 FAD-binding dehydrogenase [Helcobacillus massiliensis]MCT2035939.1 FAD-binding dehydrogenase [Helcobacillus massiliensis]MCT2331791.1 FAD-binding dehydrogenase [Helcobacillus massiliensis]
MPHRPATAPLRELTADALVIGHGLAGLAAAAELADAGRSVVLLDQEGEQDLGGQAFWSFGGLFMIDTPEQRRLGVRDSPELAHQDWMGSAQFSAATHDVRPRQWAEAYLHFAHGEKRAWLRQMGHRIFPVVGWAERGGTSASGHGNSVPRFHITWGTGEGIVEPFERRVCQHRETGRIRFAHRHRVEHLEVSGRRVLGAAGSVLAADRSRRGAASTREVIGEFTARADAVVIATGGIGGNPDLVRAMWPADLAGMPRDPVIGVPAYVDGSGLQVAEAAGAHWINKQRMWHYTEGIRNWNPIWPGHGIRILPGPSALWLDHTGHRLDAPAYPGFDTLATLRQLRERGGEHSWFIMTRAIAEKEIALSGSEQNPDITGKSWAKVAQRIRPGAPDPVQAFLDRGEDFVQATGLEELMDLMEPLSDGPLDRAAITAAVHERDNQMVNPYAKDPQVVAIRGARRFLGDRLVRTASPHRLLDASAGPLIAIRLHTLLRKTLGGLETDLGGRVLGADGAVIDGLYAAGEASGFGGGGMHGLNALEGTFLGGCLFSGRESGRSAARDIA